MSRNPLLFLSGVVAACALSATSPAAAPALSAPGTLLLAPQGGTPPGTLGGGGTPGGTPPGTIGGGGTPGGTPPGTIGGGGTPGGTPPGTLGGGGTPGGGFPPGTIGGGGRLDPSRQVILTDEGDLRTAGGQLLLDESEVEEFRPRILMDGSVGLEPAGGGWVILPCGTLVSSGLKLPAGAILSKESIQTEKSGRSQEYLTLRWWVGGQQKRFLLASADASRRDDGRLRHVERGYRLQLGGALLRLEPHVSASDVEGGLMTLRPDGLILRPDDYAYLPTSSMAVFAPDALNVVHRHWFDLDGNEREANQPVFVPDGSILMPDGTLLDPDGVNITPSNFLTSAQFWLHLEGTIYRPVVHMSPEHLPPLACLRKDGSIPLYGGNVLQLDGNIRLPDGRIVRPNGSMSSESRSAAAVQRQQGGEDGEPENL